MRIAAACKAQGIAASIVMVPGNTISDVVQRATAPIASDGRTGFDVIVMGGGDGSIRAAASVLAGGNVPLGILPLGTFNHFARDLHLPFDLEAALAVIARGHVRLVDVGEVNGQVFLNNSSLGIYPHLVAERDRKGATVSSNGERRGSPSAACCGDCRAHASASWLRVGEPCGGHPVSLSETISTDSTHSRSPGARDWKTASCVSISLIGKAGWRCCSSPSAPCSGASSPIAIFRWRV
jgi:hypothetical protein